MQLSKEMQKCIDIIRINGIIRRFEGGFWANENESLKPLLNGGVNIGSYPINHVGTNTIKSLYKRGIIKPIEFKKSKYTNSEFAIAYTLTELCDCQNPESGHKSDNCKIHN